MPKEAVKKKEKKQKPRFSHLRHPFMVPVATFLAVFFIGIVLFINQNGQTIGAGDSRLVELTQNGQTQTIPTTAETVGDLLSRLNIKVSAGDVVEPAQDVEILQNGFQINIYRVHPVTVVEGGQRTVIQTANSDPRAIAKEAGYTIYPQDNVNNVSDVTQLSGNVLGQEVSITPATPVTLNLYGSQVTIRTLAKTVGDLLNDEKIPTNSGSNNVLPALTTPITPNMQILVVPVGQHLSSTQQSIPYSVQIVPDPSLTYGIQKIEQAGQNGLALVVQDTTTTKGQTSTNQLQQVVVDPPIPEIIHRGTGIPSVAGGNNISWLKSSGINPGDYQYVNVVVNHESHWNPDSISRSGCIGLGQSCPGGSGTPGLAIVCPDWTNDAVCQLDFFNSYASRYGGWAGAAAHEDAYGWW